MTGRLQTCSMLWSDGRIAQSHVAGRGSDQIDPYIPRDRASAILNADRGEIELPRAARRTVGLERPAVVARRANEKPCSAHARCKTLGSSRTRRPPAVISVTEISCRSICTLIRQAKPWIRPVRESAAECGCAAGTVPSKTSLWRSLPRPAIQPPGHGRSVIPSITVSTKPSVFQGRAISQPLDHYLTHNLTP